MELIGQNSLYRGQEFKPTLDKFLKHKKGYDKLSAAKKKLYVWSKYGDCPPIRNTAIGTLLINVSEGMPLDMAVTSYERVVAPSNYKRPTAIVTKGMIDLAEKDLKELGMEKSIYRRHAHKDDIPVEQVIFVDRDISEGSLFDNLKEDVPVLAKSLSKVEEVTIGTFIEEVVPHATKIEVLLERNHEGNLMSLIAPKYKEAPLLFNWQNGISWSYKDNVADSIKAKVTKAGGKTDGELRFSLEWFNYDDLDIHVIEPSGHKIYYSQKRSDNGNGCLDIDMNAGGRATREPVENIIFSNRSKMQEGNYKVIVHQYDKRESTAVGFNLDIECQGQLLTFGQKTAVPDKTRVLVAEIKYSKARGMELVMGKETAANVTSIPMWNLSSNKFYRVAMVMDSPNHWGSKPTGNKHTFFILDKARNEDKPRGLFNEFLTPELHKNRKVFEILGSKLKVEDSDQQLSGLGFSSTQRNEVICKVTGKFTRTIRVKF